MKAKNIFKTLALAMLMPAMLLTSACSNINENEDTDNKGFSLPVTVNVTCQGDDATTKAKYTDNDDGTGQLSFSTGDKLFVKGTSGDAGSFAGTMDYVSDGKFSGTIYTSVEYSGTAVALLAGAATVEATLLPKYYGYYGFLTVSGEGYSATLATDATNAFATTLKAGVEQLTLERATAYSGGFALAPQNAILSFTISGFAANTAVTVSFTDDKSNVISKEITTNSVTGYAEFAIGVADKTALQNCSLTVGDKVIILTISDKELEAGKIYNASRSIATAGGHELSSAVVGDIIGSDGRAYKDIDYNRLRNGVTVVARIFHVDGNGHGLALAMADEGSMNWDTAKSTCEGKNTTTPVTNCTWKFADLSEMDNMVDGAGGYVALRDGFSRVGGTNMQAADYWVYDVYYYDTNDGIYYNFSLNGSGPSPKYNNKNVRACLEF